MAVRIRLKRMGAKRQPHYRFVVADSRSPRDGRFIEELGHYNPTASPAVIKVNEERVLHWLARGAQPSDTVRSLFRQVGLMARFRGEAGSAAGNGVEGPADAARTASGGEAEEGDAAGGADAAGAEVHGG